MNRLSPSYIVPVAALLGTLTGVVYFACSSVPQLPKLPAGDEIGKAVTIYNCIVDVQRDTQQTISELCPKAPDAGAYEQLQCPALPMLLLQLSEKIEVCKGTD